MGARRIRQWLVVVSAAWMVGCGGGGDGTDHTPSLANLSYGPARLAVKRGETGVVQGQADFSDAGGDIVEARLQIDGGPVLVVPTPTLGGVKSGTAGLNIEFSLDEAGSFPFELWVVDSGGRSSNRLGGTVETFVDDSASSWRTTAWFGGAMLSAVAWGGNRYVAVGTVGAVRTSPDGVQWTAQTSNVSHWLQSIARSGSQFAAVGQDAMTYEWVVITSPDGQTWTTRAAAVPNNPGALYRVVWTGSQFIAVGEETIYPGGSMYALILTSPDGITWTQRARGTIPGLMRSVVASGSQLVSVGASGTYDPPLSWTSQDGGSSWVASPMPGNALPSDLVFAQGRFVAVSGYAGSKTWLSTDGANWQLSSDTLSSGASAILATGSRYVAFGSTNTVYVSGDAQHWVEGRLSDFCGNGAVWDGKGFVAVGLNACKSP